MDYPGGPTHVEGQLVVQAQRMTSDCGDARYCPYCGAEYVAIVQTVLRWVSPTVLKDEKVVFRGLQLVDLMRAWHCDKCGFTQVHEGPPEAHATAARSGKMERRPDDINQEDVYRWQSQAHGPHPPAQKEEPLWLPQ